MFNFMVRGPKSAGHRHKLMVHSKMSRTVKSAHSDYLKLGRPTVAVLVLTGLILW